MQALLAKRHVQRREEGDAELLGELLDRRNDGGIARGDGKDLALEVVGCEQPQHLGGHNPAGGQPEDDEVRRPRIECCAQFTHLDALVDGEAVRAQHFPEELSNVRLPIGHTNERPAGSFFVLVHRSPSVADEGRMLQVRNVPKYGRVVACSGIGGLLLMPKQRRYFYYNPIRI